VVGTYIILIINNKLFQTRADLLLLIMAIINNNDCYNCIHNCTIVLALVQKQYQGIMIPNTCWFIIIIDKNSPTVVINKNWHINCTIVSAR